MSKKISFGSGEGFLIYDVNTKQKILDYLYSNLNLSKHRFIMLNNVNKLEQLRDDEHFIAPSFKGFNYFLIFINLDDIKNDSKQNDFKQNDFKQNDSKSRKYCVAIDRRKLSYHKDQVDIKSVFMVKSIVKVSDSMFNGTIFDGKLIESSNKFIFLIQDCFYLMGKKILDMEMSQKMGHLDNIMKLHFSDPNMCDNFVFKLNKLYTYEDLKNLIENIMPSCSIQTQGLVFYPKYSGISIIHIEKKVDKVDIVVNQQPTFESKTYDMIHNFVDYMKTRSYSYENGNKNRKYWLSRTNIPDVYNLSEKEDGEKIGIAHVPNLKTSHLCDENIKDDKPCHFNCVYHTKFKKWIPVNIC